MYASDVQQWCAGLGHADTRPLEPPELERLHQRARKLSLIGLLSLCAVPVVVLAALVALRWLPELADPKRFTLVYFSVMAVAVPLLILRAKDLFTRVRALRHDLDGGRVAGFEGSLESLDPFDLHEEFGDRDLIRLSRLGILRPGCAGRQRLEVLPTSGILLAANGRPVWDWLRLAVGRAATVPRAIFLSDLPPDAPLEPQPGTEVKRRPLSRAEAQELRGAISDMKRLPWSTLVTYACLGIALVSWARTGRPWLQEHVLLLAVLSASAIVFLLRDRRCWQRASRLDQDRELGWVASIAPRPEHALEVADQDEFTREILVASGAPWTYDGRPAPWRRASIR
ncbi:MAG: hypothetical protein MJD61_02225 [Proteobacteria bacterium]|nr:hypothetical protein [Pseudomonadota bacterium]